MNSNGSVGKQGNNDWSRWQVTKGPKEDRWRLEIQPACGMNRLLMGGKQVKFDSNQGVGESFQSKNGKGGGEGSILTSSGVYGSFLHWVAV